jgi:tripartite-type tricarboxylate transporter receptor subunit TctC
LLLYGSPIWLAPFLRDKVAYDPVKDFAPITLTTRSPTVLVVNPSVAAHSVKDLIALAKAKPGAINIAVGGSGTASHLATELFKAMAGVNMVVVPYKGSGPVITALLGGEVLMTFSNAAAIAPHVKSGRLKALAVTSAQPSPLAPELPTVAASGLPGYESTSIYGMLAPAKTPAPIITRLNQDIVKFLVQPEVKQKFLNSGVETVGNSPREFAAAIRSDMTKLGKVIKDAGIREQ